MGNTVSLLQRLRKKGNRLTPLRKAMVGELEAPEGLLSANEIIVLLKKKGLTPHKTSVYRELDFLIEQGLVRKVCLGEKEDRFEPAVTPHHHHAVCQKCGDIEHVDLEADIKKMERRLTRQQFKAENHLVEFFGLCKECQ